MEKIVIRNKVFAHTLLSADRLMMLVTSVTLYLLFIDLLRLMNVNLAELIGFALSFPFSYLMKLVILKITRLNEENEHFKRQLSFLKGKIQEAQNASFEI